MQGQSDEVPSVPWRRNTPPRGPDSQTALIAVDWGTTRFRLAALNGDGEAASTLTTTAGIGSVSGRDFEAYLLGRMAALDVDPGDCEVLLCGMIGSNIGWTDTGYIECPASPANVASRLVGAPSSQLKAAIVPGLKCTSPLGEPDVMRGEETQLLGWLSDASRDQRSGALLCLPGTHTKWVQIEESIVTHFNTSLTGELFAHLCSHSILVRGEQHANDNVFAEGLERGFRTPAISQTLFSARSRVLLKTMPETAARDYLSGLLIGADVKSAVELWKPSAAVVIGDETIAGLYATALRGLSVDAAVVDGTRMAVRGLWEIHTRIGTAP